MNAIAEFIKKKRREAGLTQLEFAQKSGLGLRFVRELEQGKETLRMDKVNAALRVFGAQAVPGQGMDVPQQPEETPHLLPPLRKVRKASKGQ